MSSYRVGAERRAVAGHETVSVSPRERHRIFCVRVAVLLLHLQVTMSTACVLVGPLRVEDAQLWISRLRRHGSFLRSTTLARATAGYAYTAVIQSSYHVVVDVYGARSRSHSQHLASHSSSAVSAARRCSSPATRRAGSLRTAAACPLLPRSYHQAGLAVTPAAGASRLR